MQLRMQMVVPLLVLMLHGTARHCGCGMRGLDALVTAALMAAKTFLWWW